MVTYSTWSNTGDEMANIFQLYFSADLLKAMVKCSHDFQLITGDVIKKKLNG